MEFPGSSRGEGVPLTPQIRRRLVEASSRTEEMLMDADVVGSIPEADQNRMTFQIEVNGDRIVPAEIPEAQLGSVIEAFRGYRQGTRARVRGTGVFDRNDRLLRLDHVETITVLEPLDIRAQLAELRTLRSGWLDGEGTAPAHAGLDWLDKGFDLRYADDLALPHVYPTPSGGVLAEWTFGELEASVEFDLEQRTGIWNLLDMNTGTEGEESLDLETEKGWDRLSDEIRRLGGADS